jgi:hypothetical protein
MSPHVGFKVLQAAERHNFIVVEDDIFCDLQVKLTPRLATLDQLNRVIYVRPRAEDRGSVTSNPGSGGGSVRHQVEPAKVGQPSGNARCFRATAAWRFLAECPSTSPLCRRRAEKRQSPRDDTFEEHLFPPTPNALATSLREPFFRCARNTGERVPKYVRCNVLQLRLCAHPVKDTNHPMKCPSPQSAGNRYGEPS